MSHQRPSFSILVLIAANLAPLFGILVILKIGMDIRLFTKSHKATPSQRRAENLGEKAKSGAKKVRKIQVESWI